MSLGIIGQKAPQQSGRPGSAKPRGNINPITGEDVTSYSSRQPSIKPESVPLLNLGVLTAQGEVRRLQGQYSYRVDTPGTASTVSWGTPQLTARSDISVYERPSVRAVSQRPEYVPQLNINNNTDNITQPKAKPKPPSAWDVDPVPLDLPGPSDEQKQQYKQYQAQLQQSYRNKGRNFSEKDIEQDIVDLKQAGTARDNKPDASQLIYKQLCKSNTDSSTDPSTMKRLDAESLKEEKRKLELIETVMADQLARPPISDVEQDSDRPVSRLHEPGMPRGVIRTLHETKYTTRKSATENLLSKRVRFGARILSRNGHDAIKELMGYFFMLDNTFTIYEYRQFGKTAKALPFLSRSDHKHCRGRLRDRTITLRDIYPGAAIVLSTRGQTPLPTSVTQRPTVTFIITDVDQQAKEEQLLRGTRGSELGARRFELNYPSDEQQLQDYKILHDLQVMVGDKLKKRGSRAVSSVGTYFRSMDTNQDGLVDRHEFRNAMKNCRIPVPDQNLDGIWNILDLDGDGKLEFTELMRGVLGSMSEYRKSFVLKAFRKIDSKKSGIITYTDIRKFYCGNKRSSVAMEIDGVELKTFLQSFDFCEDPEEVTFSEFEEYYEGVSLMVPEDQAFMAVLRKTWGI